MKRFFLILLLPAVALAQPPPSATDPLSVNASTHVVYPTDETSGIITDAMSALTVKPWCRLVNTLTDTTLSGSTTIDGSATAVGDLVLLTAQGTFSENGPWIVAAGAWTRPTWYASGHTKQAFKNIEILVMSGTRYAGTWWRISSGGSVVIDISSTTWSQTAILPTPSPTPYPTTTPYPSATPYPTSTPYPSATPYPTPTPFNATAVAAHTVFGNFTSGSALPLFNALGTGVDTFLVTPSASNLRSAITGGAVTGTSNLVFSAGSTLTGTTTVNGNLQIGTGTTAPQPLFAVAPSGGDIAMTFKVPGTGNYAQLAYKNSSDAQRGFIGYIGSTFGNALRQDHFEFGSAAGVPICFRPGDGDGAGFIMDGNSNFRIANIPVHASTQKTIDFPNTSAPVALPAGTPVGQLYMESGSLKFMNPSGTPIAITP